MIVTEQTLKLFESLTCLETGTLLPSGVTDFATGFGYFLFSDCGSQEILVVLVSVLYYGEFQLACRET